MVSMSTLNNLDAVHHRFKTVGAALMRANLNNTHSGNLSCCDPRDSARFWITASGSTCGNLSPEDLVSVRFSDMCYAGSVRPSSEANTHRRVLELPGVDACVHCHAITSTLLGFESARHPIFLSPLDSPGPSPLEHQFQPVDAWGAGLLGAVPVGAFHNTVGSSEMEQRVPAYLRQAPVAIVKGHGPFARGQSLEQCLHHLNVLEHSATVALALRRRGVEIERLTVRFGPSTVVDDVSFSIAPGEVLVFNDTRVIRARLFGRKPSGGRIEALVERLLDERRALALLRTSHSPKAGTRILFGDGDEPVIATVVARHEELFELAFSREVTATLEHFGHVPLPPYIRHADDAHDAERYQTVYAKRAGAVAAPTAGLHFTPELLRQLSTQGVRQVTLTLHVGLDTFAPVTDAAVAKVARSSRLDVLKAILAHPQLRLTLLQFAY